MREITFFVSSIGWPLFINFCLRANKRSLSSCVSAFCFSFLYAINIVFLFLHPFVFFCVFVYVFVCFWVVRGHVFIAILVILMRMVLVLCVSCFCCSLLLLCIGVSIVILCVIWVLLAVICVVLFVLCDVHYWACCDLWCNYVFELLCFVYCVLVCGLGFLYFLNLCVLFCVATLLCVYVLFSLYHRVCIL